MNAELIQAAYDKALAQPTDIQCHLPTLLQLANLVLPSQRIVELGFRYGTSTWALLKGSDSNAPVPVISYDTAPVYIDKHKELAPNFLLRVRDSRLPHPDDKNVGLLFVDTLHTYIQVKDELTAWMDRLAPNAHIALHDTNIPEVMRAVNYFLKLCDCELVSTSQECNGMVVLKYLGARK